jgi:hypothetical protein
VMVVDRVRVVRAAMVVFLSAHGPTLESRTVEVKGRLRAPHGSWLFDRSFSPGPCVVSVFRNALHPG